MSSSNPHIAVLMTAYNAERTINRAIGSLNANSEPHDIVVVDDGSRRQVRDVIPTQPNLRVLRSDINLGVAGARNLGLKYILQNNYDYVALLDADDVADPNLLEALRTHFVAHPDVGAVGSWMLRVMDSGQIICRIKLPCEPDDVALGLWYNNCLGQAAYRVEVFRKVGFYRPSLAEDYDMNRRVAQHYKLANLPRFLYHYTVSVTGVTETKRREQMHTLLGLQWHYRDLRNPHCFAGILQTLLRLALFPVRKQNTDVTVINDPPTYVWKPFLGQIKEKSSA